MSAELKIETDRLIRRYEQLHLNAGLNGDLLKPLGLVALLEILELMAHRLDMLEADSRPIKIDG